MKVGQVGGWIPAEFQLAVHCMIYRVAQDVLSLKEMQLTMRCYSLQKAKTKLKIMFAEEFCKVNSRDWYLVTP